uniref:Uncharacterized protein n=1 Tax=Cannabis sativa TaxID=3483 RepID=A0A803PR57_CANSA
MLIIANFGTKLMMAPMNDIRDAVINIVHETNSSNFSLFVDLDVLDVQQTNHPPTSIDFPQSLLTVPDDDGFIDDDEDEEILDAEDDILVDNAIDDDSIDVSPSPQIDSNLISDDDSDYYIARYHGGDGGGEDPPDPRIFTECEFTTEASEAENELSGSSRKRKRGCNVLNGLEDRRKKIFSATTSCG